MSSISLKVSGLDATLLRLAGVRKTALPVAAVRALNKVGGRARTEVDREIRNVDKVNLKQRAHIYNPAYGGLQGPNQFPGNKATFKNLRSRVTSFTRGMPIGIFLTAASIKSAPEGRIETLITFRKGEKHWPGGKLYRWGKGGAYEGWSIFVRRPGGGFRAIFGPSISQMFNRDKDKIGKLVQPELQAEFDRLVDEEFRKLVR